MGAERPPVPVPPLGLDELWAGGGARARGRGQSPERGRGGANRPQGEVQGAESFWRLPRTQLSQRERAPFSLPFHPLTQGESRSSATHLGPRYFIFYPRLKTFFSFL